MFFWNSLAFSMIQWMLAIWSLVPLPFLNPAWTSGSSRFMYCWSIAWRILSITLPACEMSECKTFNWYTELHQNYELLLFKRYWLEKEMTSYRLRGMSAYLIKDSYSKYKNSQKSIMRKKIIQFFNGQKIWTDIISKLLNTLSQIQIKYKLKPQWKT